MAETAPRSNPFAESLDNFEANKEAHEARRWLNDLQGEAGKTDFSDEAVKRLEESRDYYDHMEDLSNLPELPDPDSAEGARSRRTEFIEEIDDLNGVESDALRRQEEALETALKSGLAVRRAALYSKRAHQLRNRLDEVKADLLEAEEGDVDILKAKGQQLEADLAAIEDKLEDEIEKYSQSGEFVPEVADYLMDPSDEARENAGVGALVAAQARSRGETIPGVETDDDDDDETLAPVETDDDDETLAPVETDDDDETLEPVETDDDDETLAPVETDDDDSETRPPENLSPLDRLRRVFSRERGSSEDRETNRRIRRITLGAVAVAAVAVGFGIYHLVANKDASALSGAIGGGTPPVDPSVGMDIDGGTGSYDFGIDVIDGNPLVDTLPSSAGFEYPWNWAVEAKGAEGALSFLQELGTKAQEAGHTVEWHGSGSTQWVEVDGNSNTKDVIDVLRQYAK